MIIYVYQWFPRKKRHCTPLPAVASWMQWHIRTSKISSTPSRPHWTRCAGRIAAPRWSASNAAEANHMPWLLMHSRKDPVPQMWPELVNSETESLSLSPLNDLNGSRSYGYFWILRHLVALQLALQLTNLTISDHFPSVDQALLPHRRFHICLAFQVSLRWIGKTTFPKRKLPWKSVRSTVDVRHIRWKSMSHDHNRLSWASLSWFSTSFNIFQHLSTSFNYQ